MTLQSSLDRQSTQPTSSKLLRCSPRIVILSPSRMGSYLTIVPPRLRQVPTDTDTAVLDGAIISNADYATQTVDPTEQATDSWTAGLGLTSMMTSTEVPTAAGPTTTTTAPPTKTHRPSSTTLTIGTSTTAASIPASTTDPYDPATATTTTTSPLTLTTVWVPETASDGSTSAWTPTVFTQSFSAYPDSWPSSLSLGVYTRTQTMLVETSALSTEGAAAAAAARPRGVGGGGGVVGAAAVAAAGWAVWL